MAKASFSFLAFLKCRPTMLIALFRRSFLLPIFSLSISHLFIFTQHMSHCSNYFSPECLHATKVHMITLDQLLPSWSKFTSFVFLVKIKLRQDSEKTVWKKVFYFCTEVVFCVLYTLLICRYPHVQF